MSFNKKTIRDIDLRGKTILLRADYNVPLSESGKITDDYRIKQSLPTIKYLLDQKVKLVICSHLGRPSGPNDKKCSLKPVAERLRELLHPTSIQFLGDCVGEVVEAAVARLEPGQVALLENLRYHPEEEADNPEFAKELSKLADVFVQDGFGVVHRAHASTDAITKFLPSVAGLLLEKEVDAITKVMENPVRPLMTIVGGAKIADKIGVLKRFIEIADFVAIGGAMANTFLKAEGEPIAKSKFDPDDLPLARDILLEAKEKAKKTRFIFYLPQDGVVAKSLDKTSPTRIVDWSAHVIADVENYPKRPPHESSQIAENEMILDIGPFSGAFIAGGMQLANSVVWNGTLGVTEVRGLQGPIGPYAHGTDLIIEAMMGKFGHRPYSLVGGGDTVGYIESRGLIDGFDHVSTGGGASLELMAGETLPGIAALIDKDKH
jgi:phosphoglycerate kinase